MGATPSTDISPPPAPAPEAIRQAARGAILRARDLAASLNVSEAQLLAAQTGQGVTRIKAGPGELIGALERFGPLMALTRNESIVSEVHGTYSGFQSGDHAAMVLGPDIDLRIFPRHWVHGFAVETATDKGTRRSFQIFDAAGEAVHKIYLPLDADPSHWRGLRGWLKMEDQGDTLVCEPRPATEAATEDPDKAERLRREWDSLGDTHQFLLLTRKLKINRLGAYRMAGAPYARALAPEAAAGALNRLAESSLPAMIFAGNRGCIQIHSGPIGSIKETGPWLNVLDPGFDMHLRGDHIAEVWAATKPTRRGPAVSVEAFDAEGGLIVQIFGHRTATVDHNAPWMELVEGLPGREPAA